MHTALRLVGIGIDEDWPGVQTVLRSQPVETLLNSLVRTHGSAALTYLDVLRSGAANFNHAAPAALAAQGLLDSLVTLNFDTLHEQAILDAGVGLRWVLPLAECDAQVGNPSVSVMVVKPHGSFAHPGLPYEAHFLAATLRYAGDRPQRENRRALSRIAAGRKGLLVYGYGGEDWDVLPILASLNWSVVIWVRFSSSAKQAPEQAEPLPEPVDRWLQSRAEGQSIRLDGDPREFLSDILWELGVIADRRERNESDGNWAVATMRDPDSSSLLRHPGRTALAAIMLLDGNRIDLYGKYLERMPSITPYRAGDPDHTYWLKLHAWFLQAHRRDIQGAIRILRRIEKAKPSEEEPTLEQLGDLQSFYYASIAAAKPPRVSPLMLLDLVRAMRLWRLIRREATTVEQLNSRDPWVAKEAQRTVAYARYYVADLVHNWAYLLLLGGGLTRGAAKWTFRRIARWYARLARRYPVLDWEYHFVRRAEATLLSLGRAPGKAMDRRLEAIVEMFRQTGWGGHPENAEAIRAILHLRQSPRSAYNEFVLARDRLAHTDAKSTPAGRARMLLLERYFWPDRLGPIETVRRLWRESHG